MAVFLSCCWCFFSFVLYFPLISKGFCMNVLFLNTFNCRFENTAGRSVRFYDEMNHLTGLSWVKMWPFVSYKAGLLVVTLQLCVATLFFYSSYSQHLTKNVLRLSTWDPFPLPFSLSLSVPLFLLCALWASWKLGMLPFLRSLLIKACSWRLNLKVVFWAVLVIEDFSFFAFKFSVVYL